MNVENKVYKVFCMKKSWQIGIANWNVFVSCMVEVNMVHLMNRRDLMWVGLGRTN